MKAISLLRVLPAGLLACLAWVGPGNAGSIINEDDRAYTILIQPNDAPELQVRIEPRQKLDAAEQGMMRIVEENAYSTLNNNITYYIRGGVFITPPPPPPPHPTPVQSLPDSTGDGAW